jgi:tRNA modification GTPase
MVDLASTIVARGSAPGRAARALVRMSGDACAPVFAALAGAASFFRGVHPARLRLPSGSLACIAFVAPGPASYTGEDTLELLCVGNDWLVHEIEETLIATARRLGFAARPAAPGEFTLRAFARGKIDLTQAEGIAATIAATTDAQLRAARQLADGGLGRFVRTLADRVADDLALVEAGIDFTDQEDVVAIPPERLRADLRVMTGELDERLARSVPWERIEAVPRVVLVGPPNAGKSTLFNALLAKRRAVESATAGTTRDALEEYATLVTPRGRFEIRLVDVAGLDDVSDGGDAPTHERAMQERAHAAIARADLIVRCMPPGASPVPAKSGAAELTVRTKADLGALANDGAALAVSARTSAGLDALRAAIVDQLASRLVATDGETLVLAGRHEAALRDALTSLHEAESLVTNRGLRDPELVAAALRAALDALGSISGAIAPDDVLGRIFGRFCVGK